ncbi:GYF domain-containing protein [Tahibacter harae]|uniref:GYF domain-containing protein n=1 Tax=Tahibacter harae TaxID=2963937 RepID=A0ABT1QTX2_9GAMM|nr:GYF domain-containing protein [Tahibacter harae]MCQ4165729.1 GYF domain-containing protein [Tahibacter harae]
MSKNWYYADRRRQQQGPVSSDGLLAALQRGEVDMSSLVWHEQLPGWVPLSQVAAELGLRNVAPPPPPRPRPAAGQIAARPPRSGSSTWVIVLVVVFFFILCVGGILAAIAIPAYQDYTIRSRVAQVVLAGRAQRIAVAEFFVAQQRCPRNGDEGFNAPENYADQYVASIRFEAGAGECVMRLAARNLGSSRLDNAEIIMAMDKDMNWTEAANVPDKYLPSYMRRR